MWAQANKGQHIQHLEVLNKQPPPSASVTLKRVTVMYTELNMTQLKAKTCNYTLYTGHMKLSMKITNYEGCSKSIRPLARKNTFTHLEVCNSNPLRSSLLVTEHTSPSGSAIV